jgi:hypothetical protein
MKNIPKTNLGLRPFQHPLPAFAKLHVFLGSLRLLRGVDVTELRQYLLHIYFHHELAHSDVVDIAGQRLYGRGPCDFLQLAVGPHPMQEYARHVLGVNT